MNGQYLVIWDGGKFKSNNVEEAYKVYDSIEGWCQINTKARSGCFVTLDEKC